MYITYLILLGLAIISNSTLIYILYRIRHRAVAIVFLIVFLLLINIWIIPKFLTNAFLIDGALFENFSRVSALGYIFAPVAFVIFTFAYILHYTIFQRFLFWILLLVPAIIFLYFSWTTEYIGIHKFSAATLYSWGYETPTGEYFSLFIIWFEVVMISSIIILIRYYHTLQDEIKKRQTFFVITAVIIPFVVSTITNGLLPLWDVFIFPLGTPLISFMAACIVFAVFKYGLFEVTPLSVLSSINHAIITVDSKGNILHLNEFAEKMLGTHATEAIGTAIEQLLVVHYDKRTRRNYCKYLISQVLFKGKKITSDKYTILNKSRHVFPYVISITPVYSNKTIVGANVFLRDIRREKERERQKDDFIGLLSHELKVPITSIKAYNQLLLRQLSDKGDKRRQLVIKMDDQVDRLTRLIQNFLELSRVQVGKLKLDKEFFNIDTLIQEIVDTLSVTYKNRTIRIEGRTDAIVLADKDRITQIVINLVTNAIKYSPADKDIILLLSADDRQVTIGVKDFGKGISTEFHKKIFDRFYQIDHNQRNTEGLGVGLFLASTIVKHHEGKMWVDSAAGKGSTFYFTLPVSK